MVVDMHRTDIPCDKTAKDPKSSTVKSQTAVIPLLTFMDLPALYKLPF